MSAIWGLSENIFPLRVLPPLTPFGHPWSASACLRNLTHYRYCALQILRPPCRQPRAISQQRANSSAPRQAGRSFSLNLLKSDLPRDQQFPSRPNYNFGHQRKTSVLVNLRQPMAVITSQCAPRAGVSCIGRVVNPRMCCPTPWFGVPFPRSYRAPNLLSVPYRSLTDARLRAPHSFPLKGQQWLLEP